MLQRSDMHNYQNKAVQHILDNPNCALWLDMGLGKTISTLTAISDMLHINVSKVLIIAPLRVAHTVYTDEIKKWEHISDLKVSKVLGSERERLTGLFKKADIYVINRENIPWLVDTLKGKWDFDMVVIDESSSFKSHSSKRFKALKKVLGKVDRMVQLTGTPSPNGYLDIWSQVYLLDQGMSLGKTITQYRNSFFESDYMGYTYTLRPFAEKKIQQRIEDLILSMQVEDYLELPPSVPVVIDIPMSNKESNLYKKFEKNLIIDIESQEVTAMTAATLSNKLLQFCSGFLYNSEGSVVDVHKLKIDALKELIEENQGHNILLAYNYKYEKEMILKHIPNVVELDKQGSQVEKWNKGEIKILLTHPASAGHGLNLQKGGDIIIWFGFTWSLELYQQFNARLVRQGQDKTVRVFHLATGDIEKKLMRVISSKEVTQDKLLNALKD